MFSKISNALLPNYRLTFVLIFAANFCFSQISKKEVDSLMEKEIPRLRGSAEVEKSLFLCEKVIKDYEFLNDKKGKSEAYIVAANICMTLYRIKESFEYLELAEATNESLKNPLTEAKIYAQYARNYDYLDYESLALENYGKAISILEVLKGENKDLEYMYSSRGFLYEKKNMYKRYYKDAQKAHYYYRSPYTSVRLAKYFILYEKKLDSARYYLDLGEKLYDGGAFRMFQKALVEGMNGRYYFHQKEYEKAISFYKESLKIHKKLIIPVKLKKITNCSMKPTKRLVTKKTKNNIWKDILSSMTV